MDVEKWVKELNIKPDKKMDQFFLKDDSIISEEVKVAQLKKTDTVLEVGCGFGSLTREIAKKCRVFGIEKDYRFSSVLRGIENTNILFGDALEVLESLRKIRDAKAAKGEVAERQFNKVISNIPYSISQDLVIELFKHKWDTAVLIVQKEFAEKLKEKDKLGILMEELAEVRIVKQVPAAAFYPLAVPSSIVTLKQKKMIDENYWSFLVTIFKDRNRDVKNVMKGKNYPMTLAKKKVHQLTTTEIKKLYEICIKENLGSP